MYEQCSILQNNSELTIELHSIVDSSVDLQMLVNLLMDHAQHKNIICCEVSAAHSDVSKVGLVKVSSITNTFDNVNFIAAFLGAFVRRSRYQADIAKSIARKTSRQSKQRYV